MKKSKLGVFAVLGALPIGALTAGVLVGTAPNLDAKATDTSCTLTLSSANTPTGLDSYGNGLGVISHVEMQYAKAMTPEKGHIALQNGGYIQSSGKIYDPVAKVGGFVNGITSITVNYTDFGLDMYAGDEAFMKLDVGFEGMDDAGSSILVKSGEAIEFVGSGNHTMSNLPRNFKLKAYVSEGYPYYAMARRAAMPAQSGKGIRIDSIVINAKMIEEHDVATSTTAKNPKDIEVFFDDLNTSNDDKKLNVAKTLTALDDAQLREGQVITLKPADAAETVFVKDDIKVATISGTPITVTENAKAEGAKYPTYSFTMPKADITLAVNPSVDLRPYKGEAFIGTHTMETPDGANVDLILEDTGKFTFGSTTGKYTYDKATEKFTFPTYAKMNLTIGSAFDTTASVMYLIQNNKVYFADMEAVTGDDVARIGTTGYISIYQFICNGYTAYVYKHYSKYSILDSSYHTVTEEANGDYTITATKDATGNNILDGNNKAYESGVGELSQRLRLNGTRLDSVERDALAGTYTGGAEDPTITLNGFGQGKVGDTASDYTYDKKRNTVTIAGVEYDIDTINHTYTKHVDMADPWTLGTTTYMSGNKSFEFSNGKVRVHNSSYFWDDAENDDKVVPYDICGNKVSFTAVADGDSQYESMKDINFVFTITDGGQKLVSDVTIIKDKEQGYGWEVTVVGTETFVTKGEVFEYTPEQLEITQDFTGEKPVFTIKNTGKTYFDDVLQIRFQGTNNDGALKLVDFDGRNEYNQYVKYEAKEHIVDGKLLGYDVRIHVEQDKAITVKALIVCDVDKTVSVKTLTANSCSSTGTLTYVAPKPTNLAMTQKVTAETTTYEATVVNNGTEFTGPLQISIYNDTRKQVILTDFKVNGVAATATEIITEDGQFLGYRIDITVAAGETVTVTATYASTTPGKYRVKALAGTDNSSSEYINIPKPAEQQQ